MKKGQFKAASYHRGAIIGFPKNTVVEVAQLSQLLHKLQENHQHGFVSAIPQQITIFEPKPMQYTSS
jgi:hypothetical protein